MFAEVCGRRLLSAVVAACEDLGHRQMLAVIGGRDNLASIGLHQACGLRRPAYCDP